MQTLKSREVVVGGGGGVARLPPFLPSAIPGFGQETKIRGGIIVSPAYTYKECVKCWCSDETRRARWSRVIKSDFAVFERH